VNRGANRAFIALSHCKAISPAFSRLTTHVHDLSCVLVGVGVCFFGFVFGGFLSRGFLMVFDCVFLLVVVVGMSAPARSPRGWVGFFGVFGWRFVLRVLWLYVSAFF
jgi:hypothetical protein